MVAMVAIAAGLGAAAPAAADTLSALRENTLVLREADGKALTVLIGEDGRMEQVNAAGVWAAGFWSAGPRGLCWTARGAAEVCIALPADRQAGDAWEVAGPTGRTVWTAQIAPGRADLRALSR